MRSMQTQRGFTLTELAIVMLIIGLALVGLLGPINRQIQQAHYNVTQERLEAAREAVLSFAVTYGRLPCPDQNGDGLEDRRLDNDPARIGCLNHIYEGFLPWATLGVLQTDYWGNRFRYRVSYEFVRAGNNNNWICGATANQSLDNTKAPGCPGTLAGIGVPPLGHCSVTATNPNSCTFEIGDTGDIPIRDGQVGRPGSAYIMNPTSAPPMGAVAVILSVGANGLGGTSDFGLARPAPLAGSDEALNTPAAIPAGTVRNTPFIIRTPTDQAAGCADNGGGTLCEFDDQVVFLGVNTLISRLVQAGVRLR